jgi:chloramphenicol-sensitive protein RarD
VTAVPLLLFSAAARRIPLAVLGVLQYLTPTMHFAYGVLVLGEPMSTGRWVGFALVWVALTIFTVDLVRESRRGLSGTEAAEIGAGEAH